MTKFFILMKRPGRLIFILGLALGNLPGPGRTEYEAGKGFPAQIGTKTYKVIEDKGRVKIFDEQGQWLDDRATWIKAGFVYLVPVAKLRILECGGLTPLCVAGA